MPQLTEILKKIIHSDEFVEQHKNSPKDFTRKRSPAFDTLFSIMTNMRKGSYEEELDLWHKTVLHLEVAERFVTKGAFSTARKKIKAEAFVDINDRMLHLYYSGFPTIAWLGFTLLAIDGSTVRVPDEKEISEHFGVWNSKEGIQCPKARISQMYDVLNNTTVDAIVTPKGIGERELAARHITKLLSNDLLLLDRGYPAFWLFKLIFLWDGNFCARVPYNTWKITRKFYNSGEKDAIVKLECSCASAKKCHEEGLDKKPMRVRLVRVELENGEAEVLITSLTDRKKFDVGIFGDLYHLRWPVEEDYKAMKCRLEVENFSGKSVLSVYQDFHAKIFAKNLTMIVANTVRPALETGLEEGKSPLKINFTQSLARMKNTIVLLFVRGIESVTEIVTKLQKRFAEMAWRARPGRKFERKHKIAKRRYYLAYKHIS